MTTSIAPSHDVEYKVRLGTDLTVYAIHPEEDLDDELILAVTYCTISVALWLHVPLSELYEQLLAEHTSDTNRGDWIPLFAAKIDEVLEAEVSQLIPRDALIKLMGYISVTELP